MKSEKSKAKFGVMALVLLLAVLAFTGTASAATIFVPTDYATIQEAVDAASPGDTVFVYNGTYYDGDGVKIEKDRITLQGEDVNTTTIHGKWAAEEVVYVSGDFVNVSGFTVTGSSSYGSGIYLSHGSCNCRLSQNNATDNYDGIFLAGSSNNNTLTGNTANSNNGCGIYLYSLSNNNLTGNSANNNDYGIRLYSSKNNELKGNTADANSYGIRLESTSTENNITENTVSSNTNYGIYLDWSGENEIWHNNFINNNKQARDYYGFNNWDKGPAVGGNYWSDHICHGNPSDGTEPYEEIDTDAVAVDNYPFEDPDGWVIPPPPMPDLAISSSDISFEPDAPYEGENVRINATVRNIGTEEASGVVVKFFDNDVLIPDVQVIVFIQAGEEQTVSVEWDTTGKAGKHVINVKVDPEDEIEESCETNNDASKEITVLRPTTTIEVKTDKKTYSPGDTMNVKICVKNSGSSRDVMFGWWLTIPKLGYSNVLAYSPMAFTEDYDDCFGSSISVGDWGDAGFAGIWGVGLFEPSTGEVIDCDTAVWNYKPVVTMQKRIPVEITNEITKEIERV